MAGRFTEDQRLRVSTDGDAATEATGAIDDSIYTDDTGADDGTVIGLLKGIYAQLVIIATNTTVV